MTKVFARAAEFESGRSVKTWVLAMTAYECKTVIQKRRRRREDAGRRCGHPGQHDDPSGTPEEAFMARELERAAVDLIGELRPIDVETLSAALSGKRPDSTHATFRKRLERALTRFRAAWSSRHGTD